MRVMLIEMAFPRSASVALVFCSFSEVTTIVKSLL